MSLVFRTVIRIHLGVDFFGFFLLRFAQLLEFIVCVLPNLGIFSVIISSALVAHIFFFFFDFLWDSPDRIVGSFVVLPQIPEASFFFFFFPRLFSLFFFSYWVNSTEFFKCSDFCPLSSPLHY